jgi:hypothetical protein
MPATIQPEKKEAREAFLLRAKSASVPLETAHALYRNFLLDNLESAEVVEGESEIEKTLADGDATFKELFPLSSKIPQTELCTGDRLVVRKRVSNPTSKSAPLNIGEDELRVLAENRGVTWNAEFKDRFTSYWASDQRVDRHGDIVVQKWNFKEFEGNPTMPWSHNWEAPPIGKIIDWNVHDRQEKSYTGPSLQLIGLFAPESVSPFADSIFRLVKSGFLPGCSVGFFPTRVLKVNSPKERKELGLGPGGIVCAENTLVEMSPCTLPANSGCFAVLSAAKQKGLIRPNDHEVVRELRRTELLHGKIDKSRWIGEDSITVAMWKHLFPEVEIKAHKDVEAPVVSDSVLAALKDLGDAQEALMRSLDKHTEEISKSIQSLKTPVNPSTAQLEKMLEESSRTVRYLRS